MEVKLEYSFNSEELADLKAALDLRLKKLEKIFKNTDASDEDWSSYLNAKKLRNKIENAFQTAMGVVFYDKDDSENNSKSSNT